jgi:hypothetical protein
MKNIYFIGLIVLLFVVGCTNLESNQTGKQVNQQSNQQVNQHPDDFLDNLPSEEISNEEIEALSLTLNDEFKAEAIYQKVLGKFGDVRPFSNIINAEQKHSDSLIQLYEKYGLTVPENDWYDKVAEYNSVQEACEAGVMAEIENIELYEELFSKVNNQDITAVFTSLRDASRDKHLPAFEKCVN